MSVNLYFIGNAGCGKSSLTSAFKNWMQSNGFSCATVNLDPGVEWLPYSPDVDVRDWINLNSVMQRFGVGPNGAQIVSADLLALEIGKIKDAMEELRVDYYLIDTPGQMELFTLRESSNFVVEALGKQKSLLVFLFEPTISIKPQGFIALLLQSLSAQFRLDLPLIPILSKVDLLKQEDIENVLLWGSDPTTLYEALTREGSMTANMNIELFRVLETLDIFQNLKPVSAETGYGIVDIYSQVQFIFFGSEDLSKD
ncbi:hypothetical protein BMS3Bbin15_00737 [archaeon BMS3Bbin15]|nr:hypothetical protein BMS3Bbin15_00737 [archaeon BMS3Bbin15]